MVSYQIPEEKASFKDSFLLTFWFTKSAPGLSLALAYWENRLTWRNRAGKLKPLQSRSKKYKHFSARCQSWGQAQSGAAAILRSEENFALFICMQSLISIISFNFMSTKCCNSDTYLVLLLVLWEDNCGTCWDKIFRATLGKKQRAHTPVFGSRAPKQSMCPFESRDVISKLPVCILCWCLFCWALIASPVSCQMLPRPSPWAAEWVQHVHRVTGLWGQAEPTRAVPECVNPLQRTADAMDCDGGHRGL